VAEEFAVVSLPLEGWCEQLAGPDDWPVFTLVAVVVTKGQTHSGVLHAAQSSMSWGYLDHAALRSFSVGRGWLISGRKTAKLVLIEID
jgi:hypothetical protein